MKVLLVQPRQRQRAGHRAGFRGMAVMEPLGLEMVAGALEPEHEVELVDLLPRVDLERAIERHSPDVCGISCSYTVDVAESLRVAKVLKTLRPRTFVFIGGHHASLSPGDFAVLKRCGVNVFGTLIVDPDYDEGDFRRLRDYVRCKAIPNAWSIVLTPLPGTTLFDQVQEALTTRNWEIFDLAHAVLPTKLELERFYREYARLYATVYSPLALVERVWNVLFNRQGRNTGNLPGPALIWKSLGCLRSMADPREYLLGHIEESRLPGN